MNTCQLENKRSVKAYQLENKKMYLYVSKERKKFLVAFTRPEWKAQSITEEQWKAKIVQLREQNYAQC